MTFSPCRPFSPPRRALPALALGAALAAAGQARAQAGLPLPARDQIADGSTVSLRCGATYRGTLDLTGKSNVTVRTAGACGRATITPARPVTGWTVHAGAIWSAPIGFMPAQVAVDGVPAPLAHWPDRPWSGSAAAVPDRDLAGATLVWLDNQSVIKRVRLGGGAIPTARPFYLEGKLWMLDSPGEWAVRGQRLYLWAPDGKSPEGRVLAAAPANGIEAGGSRDVTIDGVRIFLAADGISAANASRLKVLGTVIEYSAADGIRAPGSRGLLVDASRVHGARRNGIDGGYRITGATVTNTSVSGTGMPGMPSPTEGAIMFGDGSDNRIDHVQVTGAAYHGIVVLHNLDSSVSNSTVDGACLRLADCGGIYTASRDRRALGLRIENNTVANVRGREAAGIYLDDAANGVTVSGNTIQSSTRGMLVHDGFDNAITHNTFAANGTAHLAFSQSAPGTVHGNLVAYNVFRSAGTEQTFNLDSCPDPAAFGSFDYNTYTASGAGRAFFALVWDGHADGVAVDWAAWRRTMRQDAHSAGAGR